MRIPVRGGGTFVQQRPAQRIGTATVDGSPTLLLRAPPAPQGGIHGGHVVALWTELGHGYLVSVHGSVGVPDRALVDVVLALARSMRRA